MKNYAGARLCALALLFFNAQHALGVKHVATKKMASSERTKYTCVMVADDTTYMGIALDALEEDSDLTLVEGCDSFMEDMDVYIRQSLKAETEDVEGYSIVSAVVVHVSANTWNGISNEGKLTVLSSYYGESPVYFERDTACGGQYTTLKKNCQVSEASSSGFGENTYMISRDVNDNDWGAPTTLSEVKWVVASNEMLQCVAAHQRQSSYQEFLLNNEYYDSFDECSNDQGFNFETKSYLNDNCYKANFELKECNAYPGSCSELTTDPIIFETIQSCCNHYTTTSFDSCASSENCLVHYSPPVNMCDRTGTLDLFDFAPIAWNHCNNNAQVPDNTDPTLSFPDSDTVIITFAYTYEADTYYLSSQPIAVVAEQIYDDDMFVGCKSNSPVDDSDFFFQYCGEPISAVETSLGSNGTANKQFYQLDIGTGSGLGLYESHRAVLQLPSTAPLIVSVQDKDSYAWEFKSDGSFTEVSTDPSTPNELCNIWESLGSIQNETNAYGVSEITMNLDDTGLLVELPSYLKGTCANGTSYTYTYPTYFIYSENLDLWYLTLTPDGTNEVGGNGLPISHNAITYYFRNSGLTIEHNDGKLDSYDCMMDTRETGDNNPYTQLKVLDVCGREVNSSDYCISKTVNDTTSEAIKVGLECSVFPNQQGNNSGLVTLPTEQEDLLVISEFDGTSYSDGDPYVIHGTELGGACPGDSWGFIITTGCLDNTTASGYEELPTTTTLTSLAFKQNPYTAGEMNTGKIEANYTVNSCASHGAVDESGVMGTPKCVDEDVTVYYSLPEQTANSSSEFDLAHWFGIDNPDPERLADGSKFCFITPQVYTYFLGWETEAGNFINTCGDSIDPTEIEYTKTFLAGGTEEVEQERHLFTFTEYMKARFETLTGWDESTMLAVLDVDLVYVAERIRAENYTWTNSLVPGVTNTKNSRGYQFCLSQQPALIAEAVCSHKEGDWEYTGNDPNGNEKYRVYAELDTWTEMAMTMTNYADPSNVEFISESSYTQGIEAYISSEESLNFDKDCAGDAQNTASGLMRVSQTYEENKKTYKIFPEVKETDDNCQGLSAPTMKVAFDSFVQNGTEQRFEVLDSVGVDICVDGYLDIKDRAYRDRVLVLLCSATITDTEVQLSATSTLFEYSDDDDLYKGALHETTLVYKKVSLAVEKLVDSKLCEMQNISNFTNVVEDLCAGDVLEGYTYGNGGGGGDPPAGTTYATGDTFTYSLTNEKNTEITFEGISMISGVNEVYNDSAKAFGMCSKHAQDVIYTIEAVDQCNNSYSPFAASQLALKDSNFTGGEYALTNHSTDGGAFYEHYLNIFEIEYVKLYNANNTTWEYELPVTADADMAHTSMDVTVETSELSLSGYTMAEFADSFALNLAAIAQVDATVSMNPGYITYESVLKYNATAERGQETLHITSANFDVEIEMCSMHAEFFFDSGGEDYMDYVFNYKQTDVWNETSTAGDDNATAELYDRSSFKYKTMVNLALVAPLFQASIEVDFVDACGDAAQAYMIGYYNYAIDVGSDGEVAYEMMYFNTIEFTPTIEGSSKTVYEIAYSDAKYSLPFSMVDYNVYPEKEAQRMEQEIDTYHKAGVYDTYFESFTLSIKDPAPSVSRRTMSEFVGLFDLFNHNQADTAPFAAGEDFSSYSQYMLDKYELNYCGHAHDVQVGDNYTVFEPNGDSLTIHPRSNKTAGKFGADAYEEVQLDSLNGTLKSAVFVSNDVTQTTEYSFISSKFEHLYYGDLYSDGGYADLTSMFYSTICYTTIGARIEDVTWSTFYSESWEQTSYQFCTTFEDIVQVDITEFDTSTYHTTSIDDSYTDALAEV